ncbi:MAG: hypothetical protein ACAI37_05090, partial [Chthoniobacter sp.]
MKLYDQQFVRSLRQEVRREVKTRREWMEIVRRRRWDWLFRTYDATYLRFIIPIVLATVPLGQTRWVVLGIWTVLIATLRAAQYQAFNAPRGGAGPFVSTPVSSREVFDHIAARIFRATFWVPVDAVAVIGINLLIYGKGEIQWWGVIPAVLLVWAATIAMTIALLSRLPYGSTIAIVTCGMLVFWIAFGLLDLHGSVFFGRMVASLLWLTPPGWACQIATWLVEPHARFPIESIGLLGILFALAVPWYRALAERYAYWEQEDLSPPPPPRPQMAAPAAMVDAGVAEGNEAALDPSAVKGKVPHPVEEKILRGAFLQTASAASRLGIVERFILRRFRSEAVLMDFMLGEMPRWSRQYSRALILLTVSAALVLLPSSSYSPIATMFAVMMVAVAMCIVTPILGGHWPGFYLGALQQRNIAVMALLPVSVRAVVSLLLRVNGLRFLLALPCWLAAAMIFAIAPRVSLDECLRVAVELWLLVLSLQPFIVTCHYSRGTNDMSRWYLGVGFIFFIGLLVVAGCLAIKANFHDGFLTQCGWLAVVAGMSFTFAAVYRRLYEGAHFDLLAKKTPKTNL